MRTLNVLLCSVVLAIFCGCATVKNSANLPAGTKYLAKPVADPLEGFNRGVQSFNGAANEYVVHPVASAYTYLVPGFLRAGFANFTTNLGYPLRLVNNCLQGKFSGAWDETKRFGINSTAGLLGLMDPASAWGIDPSEEDFGQTFAYYGMGPGFFINLPLLGPTTLRDGIGDILGFPFDLASWIFPSDTGDVISGAGMANELLEASATVKQFFDTNYDTYDYTRAAFMFTREADISDMDVSNVESDPDDSLGFLRLMPENERFINGGRTLSVRLPGAKRSIPFTCWLGNSKGEAAPGILVVLPGVGGHRQSNAIGAIAELYNKQGWSVIAFSSTMTPEVFLGFPETRFPGDIKHDSKYLADAISLALNKFNRKYPALAADSCSIVGYSMGALSALQMTVAGTPFNCDKVIAINPPRNPMAALAKIDEYMKIPEKWNDGDADELSRDMFRRTAIALRDEEELPLSREESQFLMALFLRIPLANAIQAGVAKCKLPFRDFTGKVKLSELLSVSWEDYGKEAVYAAIGDKNEDLETFAKSMELDAIADKLQQDERIILLTNRNDFLLNNEDADWFKQTLGDRAVIMERGGHLGSIYTDDYKAMLLDLIKNK